MTNNKICIMNLNYKLQIKKINYTVNAKHVIPWY